VSVITGGKGASTEVALEIPHKEEKVSGLVLSDRKRDGRGTKDKNLQEKMVTGNEESHVKPTWDKGKKGGTVTTRVP